jgi:hypothetical protein
MLRLLYPAVKVPVVLRATGAVAVRDAVTSKATNVSDRNRNLAVQFISHNTPWLINKKMLRTLQM